MPYAYYMDKSLVAAWAIALSVFISFAAWFGFQMVDMVDARLDQIEQTAIEYGVGK